MTFPASTYITSICPSSLLCTADDSAVIFERTKIGLLQTVVAAERSYGSSYAYFGAVPTVKEVLKSSHLYDCTKYKIQLLVCQSIFID